MSKVKYYYDPETLSYKPVEYPRTLRISNFFIFLISSFLFGLFVLFGILTTDFLNTPEELLLKRELKKRPTICCMIDFLWFHLFFMWDPLHSNGSSCCFLIFLNILGSKFLVVLRFLQVLEGLERSARQVG